MPYIACSYMLRRAREAMILTLIAVKCFSSAGLDKRDVRKFFSRACGYDEIVEIDFGRVDSWSCIYDC